MKRSGCSECEGIAVDQEIRTPGELKRVLETVAAEVSRGALEQHPLPISPAVEPPEVSELLAKPWPDAFHSGFRCRHCGQLFELHCETYHGSGGRWAVTDPAQV